MSDQDARQGRLAELQTLADELIAFTDEDERMIHLADASYVMQAISDIPWLIGELRAAELRISRLTFSRDMFRHRTALGSRVHNHVDHREACEAYLALFAQEPYPAGLVVPGNA
jgi:hypothetical protein